MSISWTRPKKKKILNSFKHIATIFHTPSKILEVCILHLRNLRDQFTFIEMTILKGLSLYLF